MKKSFEESSRKGIKEVLLATTLLLRADVSFRKRAETDPDFWVGVLGYYLYDEGTKFRRN